ncbi:MAG: hypothetical protein ACRC28_16565 [Clostridium sp.]|uniref:hypothetical protein n=1 Tax=Clostridium sp. TaxID=1506 RepID=UPI003F36A783
MKNLLLIGYSPLIIKNLEYRNDIKIFIVEEEELFIANNFKKKEIIKSPIVGDLIFSKYMNDLEFMEAVEYINESNKIDGVYAIRDYAVRAAAEIISKFELRGIGIEA